MKKLILVLFITVFAVSFVQAQGKIAIGANGGVFLPMGDFGDGYDMGFGGNAIFVYHLQPNLDITGSAGYQTWSGKNADYTFSSIPVLAGIRYFFGKGKFLPYVNGELGMHFVTVDVPAIVIPGFGTVGGGSSSDSFFGFGAGGGFLYEIGNKLNLDVNAKFNSISSEGGSSNYINITGGVLVELN